MMSPALLFMWIPVIGLAAILLPGTLLLGVAVGIGDASRPRPVERPRAGQPGPPVLQELPRKAAAADRPERGCSGWRRSSRSTVGSGRELRGRGLTVQEIAAALGDSRRTAFRYLATAPAS